MKIMLRLSTLLLLAALAGCGHTDDTTPALSATTAAEPSVVVSASASASTAEPQIPAPDVPIVDLAGVTTLPAPPAESAPRVAAVRWLTRIYARRHRDGKTIGFLRAGSIVEAKTGKPFAAGGGCKTGWLELQPAGFVCMGDVSQQLDDELVRATSRRPDYTHRLPYMYGTVTRGGPVYQRIPTADDLKKFEPNLKRHLRKWRDDEVSGARYGLDVWLRYTSGRIVPNAIEALQSKVTDPDVPWFLSDHRRIPELSARVRKAGDDAVKVDQVDRRQGRSFIHSFLFEGRRYNVTPDLVVIPADRFRPIRGSGFRGWQVDEELTFPFALIRRSGGNKWQWRNSSKRMVASGKLPWRTAVLLTGKQKFYKKRLYYQTKDGDWIDDRHASRIDPAKRWPKWAKQGGKWIDVNITKQVLVAYEGKKMVYATIVSTGEAGLGDPEESTATKRGIFRIHTKWVSSTMDSDVVGEEFELRDVPYVQYFEGGYALHGAYWHDSFGRPKSHGCINLAPEDARRLFFWTDPQVPVGWHGAKKSLTGTIVFVHP